MKLSKFCIRYIKSNAFISLAFSSKPICEIWTGKAFDIPVKYYDFKILRVSAITGETLMPTVEIILEDK